MPTQPWTPRRPYRPFADPLRGLVPAGDATRGGRLPPQRGAQPPAVGPAIALAGPWAACLALQQRLQASPDRFAGTPFTPTPHL